MQHETRFMDYSGYKIEEKVILLTIVHNVLKTFTMIFKLSKATAFKFWVKF